MAVLHLRIARGWRLVTYVCCILFGGLALFGIVFYSLSESAESSRVYWLVVPLFAIILIFCIYGIVETMRHTVIVGDCGIQLISIFYRRELSFDQIRGFSKDEYYLILWPRTEEFSKIKVSLFLEQYATINDLVSQRFHYLHTPDADECSFVAVNDYTRAGVKVKRVVRILTVSSVAACIWVYFWPYPYELAVSVTIVLPLISLLILGRFKGVVTFNEEKNQTRPSVFISVFMPVCTLALVALRDVKIFSYHDFFIFGVITSLLMLILTFASTNEFRKSNIGSWVVVPIAMVLYFAYGMMSSILFNAIWDTSTPTYYSVKILDKSVSRGKSTSYHLNLDVWGPVKEQERVSVSHSFHDSKHIGDTVRIQLKQGKLQIPWYTIVGQ